MAERPTRIWFDGSARPNPGVVTTAVVARGEVHVRAEPLPGDNNDAEWRALLHAVEVARGLGLANVTFQGDSALVAGQASGKAPCRDERFRTYLATYRAAVEGLGKVRVRQIGRAQNLAGIALERMHGRL